jgi:hypothetical protein
MSVVEVRCVRGGRACGFCAMAGSSQHLQGQGPRGLRLITGRVAAVLCCTGPAEFVSKRLVKKFQFIPLIKLLDAWM